MNSKVKKVVIPVAGLGTRMLPATKAIPKEMLPIVDKPLIQYIVDECCYAGITEIILVTHSSKNAIENHFDKSFELETTLEKRVKRQLLEEIQAICPDGVTIMHVRQGEAMGLGHAISKARPIIGDDDFAVVLPDVLIDCSLSDLRKDNMAAMMRRFEDTGISQIMVEPVPIDTIHNYGVADCNGNSFDSGNFSKILSIVEKPDIEKAPSNLSVVGRYIFTNKIWEFLENLSPGAGGEIQLTDAIAKLMSVEEVEAYNIIGKSHDCGSKIGYMKAFVEYGMRHEEKGIEFNEFIKSLT